jgi:capsular exopolysaccharide synthesis family protein
MVVICLTAGFAYNAFSPTLYTATARLYVEREGPRIISENEGMMTESRNYVYTQGALIRSNPILSRTLQTPGLRELSFFQTETGPVADPLAFLKAPLHVSIGADDDIISIALDAANPSDASAVVDAVATAYIEHNAAQKQSITTKVLDILVDSKSKSDADLGQKVENMLDFHKTNGSLAFQNNTGSIESSRLNRLADALTDAQLAASEAKADFQAIDAAIETPESMRSLIDTQRAKGVIREVDSHRSQLRSELGQLEGQLAKLRQTLTDDAPATLAVSSRIANIQKQIHNEELRIAKDYLDAMHQRWFDAELKVTEIQASYDEQHTLAESVSAKATQLTLLEKDLARSEKQSDVLDARIKELGVIDNVGALNITMLETATVTASEANPNFAKIMAISLVLGLMLGVAATLLRDAVDLRFRSADEVLSTLGVPVLGVVPHIKSKTHNKVGKHVDRHHNSVVSEAYRSIRTAVYFSAQGKSKRVLVTSSLSGEGKTTLSSNLAITMAHAGHRTLIIDADFRNPCQQKVFKADAHIGLASVLSEGPNAPTLEQAITSTDIEGLDLLPCGPIPPNPSEMLNSEAFTNALEELSEKYDQIVIDSAPVLAVADARILASMCDVSLLVLRAETTRKQAQQATNSLHSVGSNVLGAVVNNEKRGSGHYTFANYSYGYYGATAYPNNKNKKAA